VTDVEPQTDDPPREGSPSTETHEPCPECGTVYKLPYLYHHLRKTHGIYGGETGTKRRQSFQKKLLSCDQCARGFETKQGLAMHMVRVHTESSYPKAAVKSPKRMQVMGASVPSVLTNGQTSHQFTVMEGFLLLQDEDGGIWIAEQIR
jgi:uncharacterized C2H2 Zn-finger protein